MTTTAPTFADALAAIPDHRRNQFPPRPGQFSTKPPTTDTVNAWVRECRAHAARVVDHLAIVVNSALDRGDLRTAREVLAEVNLFVAVRDAQ